MASESLIDYMRPGFPDDVDSENGKRIRIEYVGPKATLEGARPAHDSTWGDHPGRVKYTSIVPQEGGTHAVLTVELEENGDVGESGGTAVAREVTYEVEWVVASRNLLEHPAFVLGGGGSNELKASDIAAIEKWQNEEVTNKKDYKYTTESGVSTLEPNAKLYAALLQRGVEYFEDYLPVVRKITTYTDYPPSTSACGQKDNPPSAAGGPPGYEWRKTADRATRGDGKRKWDRQEEWQGAKKVLLDKDQIFITA